jgi:hypothetical protein
MGHHAADEKSRLSTTVVDRCPRDRSCPVLSLRDRILTDRGTEDCGAQDRHDANVVLVEERCQSESKSAYCRHYWPAARDPPVMDTTPSHIGFRWVLRIT